MPKSPIWADRPDRASFDKWHHSPAPLDEETVDRLRRVCRGETRIAEAWLTGSRLTHADGSWSDGTDIALILEPAFGATDGATDEEWELADRLVEAELPGEGSWFFVAREMLEAHAEQCIRMYVRVQGGD